MRGLKNDESSQELLDGHITDYNFCINHQSLQKTLAQEAGLKVKGWKEVIENAQVHNTTKESQNNKIETIEVKPK
jgi:hypothetical protein